MTNASEEQTYLREFIGRLDQPKFTSRDSYLAFCNQVITDYKAAALTPPECTAFNAHLARIAQGGSHIINTPWGGVDIEKHEHPIVEKYLVVQAGKFLAFEKHEQKLETLTVKEGHGVLVFRPEGSDQLKAEALIPGYTRTLKPGQEHTIVALSNLLVFESSLDHKGMDQDLIFIFEP